MATWDRSTPWRQGSVLTAEAAAAFELFSHRSPNDTAVVVISHDCDLAQSVEREPVVEAIVGRFVEKADGTYTNCKNLRCLHLPYSPSSDGCAIELEQQKRVSLKKSANAGAGVADFAPRNDISLTHQGRRTLQRWLAARYDRSVFSDEFDRRLNEETGVAEPLAKAFKESGKYIPAVFFDVDDGEELCRNGANDPYQLIVTLLYSTDESAEAGEKAATAAKKRVEEIFESRCSIRTAEGTVHWQWLELQAVEVMSDQSLTYAQSLLLTKWQADHVSLRADPQQSMVKT